MINKESNNYTHKIYEIDNEEKSIKYVKFKAFTYIVKDNSDNIIDKIHE